MSDVAILKGRCLCGAVTVEAEPARQELHACHCEMCRRWTGAGFLEVDVKGASLKAEGPVKAYASSDWAERAWCETCGSHLWYRVTLPGHDFVAVSAGLFDDAAGLSLAKELFIDVKPAGYAYEGDHPKVTRAEVLASFAESGE